MKPSKPPGKVPPPPTPRADVQVGRNRCPFCHTDVQVAQDDWVACKRCLGRHHRACWDEGGRCGACGGSRRVAEMQPPAPARRRGVLALLAALVAAAGLALTLAPGSDSSAAEQAQVEQALALMSRAVESDDVTRWFPFLLRGYAQLPPHRRDEPLATFRLDEFRQGCHMKLVEEGYPAARVTEAEWAAIHAQLRQVEPERNRLGVIRDLLGKSDLRFGEELQVYRPEEREALLHGSGPVSPQLLQRAEELLRTWYGNLRERNLFTSEAFEDPPPAREPLRGPPPADPDAAGFRPGVQWTSAGGFTVRLKQVEGHWLPWVVESDEAYERSRHGAIERH